MCHISECFVASGSCSRMSGCKAFWGSMKATKWVARWHYLEATMWPRMPCSFQVLPALQSIQNRVTTNLWLATHTGLVQPDQRRRKGHTPNIESFWKTSGKLSLYHPQLITTCSCKLYKDILCYRSQTLAWGGLFWTAACITKLSIIVFKHYAMTSQSRYF